MRLRALGVLWLLGLFGIAGCGANAGHALVVPVPAAYVAGVNPLFPTSSYDAHVRNLLLAGKVTEALGYVKDHYGRIPAWLRSYAAAFDAANQAFGRCQHVAKAIHAGFTRLGERPEYVALRTRWDFPVFRMPDGKEKALAETGYHVVVKVGDMVFDAYTGPTGMKFADYLSRLSVPSGHSITTAIVSKP